MRVNFNKVWQADIAGEVYFSGGGSNQHKLLSFCHLLWISEGIVSTLDHKPHLLGQNKDVSCHFLWTSVGNWKPSHRLSPCV